MGHQVDGDRRHHAGVGDPLRGDDRRDLRCAGMRSGKNLVGTGHHGREGNSPRVRVEHGDDEQYPIAFTDRVAIGETGGKGV